MTLENSERPRAARVRRTGIALVHAGELILPAAGSEAEADRVEADERNTIHYHFPVEIEVRTTPATIDVEEVVQRALNRLAAQIENL